MKSQLESIEREAAELKTEITELRIERDGFKRQVIDLEKEKKKLEIENEELYELLEHEIEKRSEEVGSLREDNKKLSLKVADYSSGKARRSNEGKQKAGVDSKDVRQSERIEDVRKARI